MESFANPYLSNFYKCESSDKKLNIAIAKLRVQKQKYRKPCPKYYLL